MCGIAGILDPAASTSADRLGALASTMASSAGASWARRPVASGSTLRQESRSVTGAWPSSTSDRAERNPWSRPVGGG